ncbi:hypothetical protein BCR43DRAFT_495498 [Syncephalastrum racemosum]|uniref:Uncharacterized protein n=1 Tax=Syncephalastrum racemosum TaxID=13706 RepID=A0A1X2H5Y2_SYNRA|nr:hypothetical protein BCR43DRAFT_495498 [Syncephalastrum racemosum]
MPFPSSASAGPNATSSPATETTEHIAVTAAAEAEAGALVEHDEEYTTASGTTSPVLTHRNDYPAAPPMLSNPLPLHANLVEFALKYNVSHLDSDDSNNDDNKTNDARYTVCLKENQVMFYRPQMALQRVFQASAETASPAATASGAKTMTAGSMLRYVTLYDMQRRALWSLTSRDWQTLYFSSSPSPHTIVAVHTSPSVFTFTWLDHQHYHWRLVPNQDEGHDLRCYHDDKRTVVAEITQNGSRFATWSTTDDNDTRTTFLVLTGLLIHDYFVNADQMEPEDDAASIASSLYYREPSLYCADQGLVDLSNANGVRRGAGLERGQSVKSIELDPGIWHCFFGQGCWWTWCACCMPGGWCDRLWINCRLGLRHRHNNPVLSRSRQRRQRGWQQHHADQE